MSGGSMDYLCFKVEDVALELIGNENTEQLRYRKIFGEILKEISFVLHEIEWVDSGDCVYPDDVEAIKDFLNKYGINHESKEV